MNTDQQVNKRTRADIPEKYRWRLEDIFPDDESWEAAWQAISPLLDDLFTHRGKLGSGASELAEALEKTSCIYLELMELLAYARMRRDEDNTVAKYRNMADRATSLYYQSASAMAFLTPEIAALPEDLVNDWLATEPRLQPFRQTLLDVMRTRPHILPENEEALLSRFGPVAEGLGDIFSMLNDVDIRLGDIDDGRGGKIELTHAEFSRLRENPDRKVRAAAFEQMHQAYGNIGGTLSVLYSTQVKADLVVAKTRRYQNSLQAALFNDNLPDSIYSTLIAEVRNGLPILGCYLNLRKSCMNLEELHLYDTYVPMLSQPVRQYTFEQACDLLRAGLAPLGEQYLADLELHLNNRWIDVYETPGKTSGAFSWGTYKSHPYVLLNFNGTFSDVFTLAHEVGHSMHTFYSHKRHYAESSYPIFLAEIASTVNENLLMRHLLDRCDENTAEGKQEKAYLLNHFLEEFRQTVFRQTLFAEFEWRAHQRAEEGEALTADWLCDLYAGLLDDYYGSVARIDDYMKWEWARIPHFYNAYYVFKYATGFSAAVALSQRILSDAPEARSRYLQFLGAGSSDYPMAILNRAGVDLTTGEPVKAALTEFAASLDQLALLINGGSD
ncbi:MAG: oligoendopeptidase F [Saccharofermentanales bacterium]|jgi:oligoendopeptidase F